MAQRPYQELGKRIKLRRIEVGHEEGERLTQDALAGRISVAGSTVTAWEIGKQRPEGENLLALARELGVTPEWLLHGPGAELDEHERLDLYEGALSEIEEIIHRVKGRRRERAEAASRAQQRAREAHGESTSTPQARSGSR